MVCLCPLTGYQCIAPARLRASHGGRHQLITRVQSTRRSDLRQNARENLQSQGGLPERYCDHHAFSLNKKSIFGFEPPASRAPALVTVNGSSLLASSSMECICVTASRELGDACSGTFYLCCCSKAEVLGHSTLLKVFRARFASSTTSSGAPRKSKAVA